MWVGALVAAPSSGFNDDGRNALRMLAEPTVLALSLVIAWHDERAGEAWSLYL
jgi:hypothetical protein